jgi:glycosyltransferase involved in cell wall biosynthesis
MKITFLISGSVRSNFSYRAIVFAKALHKLGYDISVIAPSADKYNNFVSEHIDSIDGVRVLQPFQFSTKRPEINLVPYLFGALKMVLKEKPDLVYIYKPTPVSVVGFAIRLFRKPTIILDVDDLGSEVMRIEGHPWYQRKLVEWSENFGVKHADRIVVASSYLFQKYQKEFPNKPIHIIPNGIEKDWFSEAVSSPEKRRIIFLGSVNRKSILGPLFDVLPEIVESCPDVKVLIIGDGKDLKYFQKKSENLKVSSCVIFAGWLDIAEARSYLCIGDIGYNYMPDETTVRAASNMKVPQYMSRGVVPLVSAVGDLPATVDFGKAGYICAADDPRELKITLVEALRDSGRLEKAQKARAFAAEKFDMDRLASDFSQWLATAK